MGNPVTSIGSELRDALVARALECGFSAAGIAAVPEDNPDLRRRYESWVDQGYAGEMGYLQRRDEAGQLLRSSLRVAIPWARSVIVCSLNYNAPHPKSIDPAPEGAGWIARYAWSGRPEGDSLSPTDYHDVLLSKLRGVEEFLREQAGPDLEVRSYVDTGPVVERGFAEAAGVGWVGKNTCLIQQGTGSWTLLAVIVTSLPLIREAELLPAADRCGTCTRCLDACPTGALIAPRQMDARKCIAYLTIEKKGEIEEELRPLMGRQIFGCDICQDVCPWNRKAPVGSTTEMQARTELVNPDLAMLAAMTPAEFRTRFRGSPLERTRLKRLRRNIAIAMGNSEDARYLPQLEAWQQSEDAVLRTTAAWAVQRITHSRQRAVI
ncbi:MAG: tRNA epoxyqueuosine(34) reductase QueG [Acidobacteria bacterium]|nr:tRNA epoxyqueuosine(34) reductase QueG [Acidobacteriota bacterium]